jgi:hypothetical protein
VLILFVPLILSSDLTFNGLRGFGGRNFLSSSADAETPEQGACGLSLREGQVIHGAATRFHFLQEIGACAVPRRLNPSHSL